MTLTDRQRTDLELEFLAADLGKFSREAPMSTIKRELTRALHEAPFASPERVIGWVINCLDKVVAQWERPELHLDPKVTDGVRQAATIIAEAAERAGLSTPTQPVPRRPGEPASPAELAEVAADTIDSHLDDPAGWVPSDGGSDSFDVRGDLMGRHRHRRTDPACRYHRRPRGRLSRWWFDRHRGLACLACRRSVLGPANAPDRLIHVEGLVSEERAAAVKAATALAAAQDELERRISECETHRVLIDAVRAEREAERPFEADAKPADIGWKGIAAACQRLAAARAHRAAIVDSLAAGGAA